MKLIFEKSVSGRRGVRLPKGDVPPAVDDLKAYRRAEPPELPEVSELDAVRHFTELSRRNFGVDTNFYPLGSCTMKYNPKINETLCRLPGFSQIHPFQDEPGLRGALKMMGDLACYLAEISGMDTVTLQPAAGAHGEMTGIKIMRAYHEAKGYARKKIILPDSAHGTNPASAAISGYETVQIRSTPEGLVDLDDLKANLDEDVAGFMLTNPNTLGLFETQVFEIAEALHTVDALFYMDGANLNALLGLARPGDMGFDIVHINLHKTFSTPHGGGGPGSGPVGVVSKLKDFLPKPIITCKGEDYQLDWHAKESIGKIHGFYGNFGVMVRAYVYIRMLAQEGLRQVSENAILNANYMMRRLENHFLLPHKQHHMHEFVLSGDLQKKNDIKTLDMAKRLLDYGMHAPTVYFPLIVHEAMMIEPTETESKESLDYFVDTMIAIAKEAETEPDCLKSAPQTTPVSRLDEALAARNLDVRYRFDQIGTD